jgi:hypothetical protein
MNCRKLAKLMPELAAGELNNALTEEAQRHIAECPSCSDELSRYKNALSALSAPKTSVAVPDALAVLQIPDESPVRIFPRRLAFAGAALAAVICLIFMLLPIGRNHNRPDNTLITFKPGRTLEKSAPPTKIGPVKAVKNGIKQPNTRPQTVRRFVRYKKNTAPRIQPPQSEPKIEFIPKELPKQEIIVEGPVQEKPKPMYVIATKVEMPPTVEVESYDTATGTYSMYYASYDSSGNEMIAMHSSINTTEEGE